MIQEMTQLECEAVRGGFELSSAEDCYEVRGGLEIQPFAQSTEDSNNSGV